MNLQKTKPINEYFGYERKHKKIVLCPKCKGKGNIYYTPYRPNDKQYWVYKYRIVGVNCNHNFEGEIFGFHDFVKSIMPTAQTKLFNF